MPLKNLLERLFMHCVLSSEVSLMLSVASHTWTFILIFAWLSGSVGDAKNKKRRLNVKNNFFMHFEVMEIYILRLKITEHCKYSLVYNSSEVKSVNQTLLYLRLTVTLWPGKYLLIHRSFTEMWRRFILNK